MDAIIKKVQELNAELIPPYYVLAETSEVVKEKSISPLIITKETPTFDIKYFDLVAVNILLANNNKVIYEPPAEIAELVCNLFYISNLRCKFYTPEQSERVYEALAFNTLPSNMLVYQFLNKVIQDPYKLGSIWFQYMILLWGFISPRNSDTRPYRSRSLVGYANRCFLTSNRDEHEHDLLCDGLNMLEALKSYILLCTRDKRYQNSNYINYMVDSLQMFIVIYLAALIRRSCTWPELSKLGSAVLNQKLRFHENIVKIHYEIHKQTGAVNQ